MAINIYCVRHLPTQCNSSHTITGDTDPPILEESLKNAEKIIPVINSWNITRIGTGTKLRQTQTARFIGDSIGIQVDEDIRLNERGSGRFEGLNYQEVQTGGLSLQIYLALKEDYEDDSNPHILKKPGNPGEKLVDARCRVSSYLDEKIWYPNVPDNETTLLVVSELLYYYLLGEMFSRKTSKPISNNFLPLTGISRLANFHYSQYIIYNPNNPKERITEQVKGNAKIPTTLG